MPALRIFDLSGGLQTKTSRFLMKQNEVLTAKNVVFDKIGGVRRREGYKTAGSNPAPYPGKKITALYNYNKSGGGSYQLAVVDDTYLYARMVWDSYYQVNWNLLTASLTKNEFVVTRFATFLNQVFIVNGYDHPMNWDGTTFINTDSGNVNGAPYGHFIEVYLDRLYIANTFARPARVYFSSIPSADGTSITWNTTDGTGDYFETGKGPITGLGKNSNRLLIFEEDRLLRWDTNSLVTVSEDIGTPFQQSVANWQAYTFFFHRSALSGLSGVYRYAGTYPILISQKVQDEIESVKDAGPNECCAGVSGTHYYLRLKDFLFDYDILQNSWTVHELAVNPLALSSAGQSGYRRFCFAEDATTGRVMEFPTGNTDDGATIPAELETRWYFPAGPETTCSFQEIHVFGDNLQNAQISFRIEGDEVGEWQKIGEVRRRYGKHLFNAMGRGIQFKVTQNNAGDPFYLEGFVVIYEPEGVR